MFKKYLVTDIITVVAGFLPLLLGFIVLVGWYLKLENLIQVSPSFVPMQYNTALGFLFCGIGLILISDIFVFKWRMLVLKVIGSVVVIIGVLTLIQYIFNVDLGLDELFMKHYILVKSSHPGRMAPNTALCFFLTGIAILIPTYQKGKGFLWLLGVLGVLVLGLGTISLVGYTTGLENAYGWGRLTSMAIHTSVGFIFLGLGFLAYSWNRYGTDESPFMMRIKIAMRLPLIIVFFSLISAFTIGIFTYQASISELRLAAEQELVALRETRKVEFDRYLKAIRGDLNVISNSYEVKSAVKEFSKSFIKLQSDQENVERALKKIYNVADPSGKSLSASSTSVNYQKIHKAYDPWFRLISKVRGYYDIFLFDTHGNMIYSVSKEEDFATNIYRGRWSQTSLSKVADQSLNSSDKLAYFADFQTYAPSDDKPASFIAMPVRENGETIGSIALQMPTKRINQIMQSVAGMGHTGETYVVGEDRLMRTDSRFSDESTILKTKVETLATEKALSGESGIKEIIDYRGVPVLSAYEPVDFNSVRWAIISEVDTEEVFEANVKMKNFLLVIGVFIALLIATLGLIFSRSVTVPLAALSATFHEFGKKQTIKSIPGTRRKDEIGEMARNFEILTRDIKGHMGTIHDKNEMLESLSTKLSKYLSPQVYESIFKGRKASTLVTERKKLTVFFSDIQNFTETTNALQPEDITYILNDYFTQMSDIALEFGATIDKFIGDAMLIFFGDPETKGVKEDALLCVKMALAMQKRMVGLREEWLHKGYMKPFHMRIGINTGYCDVGNFGSVDRMDYTIIGGEVNLASRLESSCDPDGILLSGSTNALVHELVSTIEKEPILVKGFKTKIQTYAVEDVQDEIEHDDRFIRVDSNGMLVDIDLEKLSPEEKANALEKLKNITNKLKNI